MSLQPLLPQSETLAQRLAAGRFVITAEVMPPVSCNPDDLTAKALPLRGLADAFNITDGAGAHAHMSATAAAALLIGVGIEPILQLTCRDRNRIALQGELMGAAALGVRNLLLLRGDDPSAGDQPDAKPVFDLDSRSLAETAHAIRDGRLPHGAKVAGTAPFFIGAADIPIDPPPGCHFHTRCRFAERPCETIDPALGAWSGLQSHVVACHMHDLTSGHSRLAHV